MNFRGSRNATRETRPIDTESFQRLNRATIATICCYSVQSTKSYYLSDGGQARGGIQSRPDGGGDLTCSGKLTIHTSVDRANSSNTHTAPSARVLGWSPVRSSPGNHWSDLRLVPLAHSSSPRLLGLCVGVGWPSLWLVFGHVNLEWTLIASRRCGPTLGCLVSYLVRTGVADKNSLNNNKVPVIVAWYWNLDFKISDKMIGDRMDLYFGQASPCCGKRKINRMGWRNWIFVESLWFSR